MSRNKFLILIVSITATFVISSVIFFLIGEIIHLHKKETEHPVMPTAEIFYSAIISFPVSIFFFIYIYKMLIKKYY